MLRLCNDLCLLHCDNLQEKDSSIKNILIKKKQLFFFYICEVQFFLHCNTTT